MSTSENTSAQARYSRVTCVDPSFDDAKLTGRLGRCWTYVVDDVEATLGALAAGASPCTRKTKRGGAVTRSLAALGGDRKRQERAGNRNRQGAAWHGMLGGASRRGERTRSDGSEGGRLWTARSPDFTRGSGPRPPRSGCRSGPRRWCPKGKGKPAARGGSSSSSSRSAMAGAPTIFPPSPSRPRLPMEDRSRPAEILKGENDERPRACSRKTALSSLHTPN